MSRAETRLAKAEQRVKTLALTGIRTLTLAGLAAILFEETLPEPIAKPVVVTTILLSAALHVWSWSKARRWIPK